MKKITLIAAVLLTFVLTSCDGLGKPENSYDCKDRLDVQLKDGSALWVYKGSVTEGYVKGNNEEGHKIWVPMSHVATIIEVDCGNGK